MSKSPLKEIDIDFLVFVERHASNLLKWDIITFFAHHPDNTVSSHELSKLIQQNKQQVQRELDNFRLLAVLQLADISDEGQRYRLSDDSRIRQTVLKFATMNNSASTSTDNIPT